MSQEARSILAAALSAAIGSLVLPNLPMNINSENYSFSEQSHVNHYELNLRQCHLINGPVPKTKYCVFKNGAKEIFIQSIFSNLNLSLTQEYIPENSLSVHLPLTSTIQELKSIIQARRNFPLSDQELIFNGLILKDQLTLIEYNIKEYSIIELNLSNDHMQNDQEYDETTILENEIIQSSSSELTQAEHTSSIAYINPNLLHSQYDFDFSYVVDHKKFYRGGLKYHRPCSWQRFALRVLNQYEPNIWLGVQDETNKDDDTLVYTRKSEYASESYEWPVSYHATGTFNDSYTMADIGSSKLKSNFKFLGKYIMNKLFGNHKENIKKKFPYGRGIYTTPNIKIAAQFANRFEFEGVKYLVLFQNRVNPKTLTKVRDFWISPKMDDVRTYGICIKRDPCQMS
ncbi:6910_t:CDS:1 [Funneliformis geosporum]|uniref:3753_t:CDS:1 n=1 Tax=Funneliformis geosporum TaxID=1117311 RepID=A0A9W4WTH9_9GLOM|nr:6910_t:CDS:1 [Funneliformis geosporum]CAI2177778.1 3753_t:CDS:1 [Funneliformis geosporum]